MKSFLRQSRLLILLVIVFAVNGLIVSFIHQKSSILSTQRFGTKLFNAAPTSVSTSVKSKVRRQSTTEKVSKSKSPSDTPPKRTRAKKSSSNSSPTTQNENIEGKGSSLICKLIATDIRLFF